MSATPAVDILLATYNGERYLAEQIDSLFAQTFEDWRVIARDDGSTDGTVRILQDYATRHPGRFVLIEDGDRGLGACGNFGRLMEHSTADYVMFCDQDDVWLPEKTATLMAAMRDLEEQCGTEIPLLVHSDLRVVGPDLEILHESFWAFQSIEPTFGRSVGRLLIQNVVTGCASMCNRSSIKIALPIPAAAMMHDWWIALLAASFGRTAYVPAATILYRQHGGNTLGAKQFGLWAMLFRGIRSPVTAFARARNVITATERQAQAFLWIYGERLPGPVRYRISKFATLSAQGLIERRLTILRYRFFTNRLFPRLILLAAV